MEKFNTITRYVTKFKMTILDIAKRNNSNYVTKRSKAWYLTIRLEFSFKLCTTNQILAS